MSEGHGIPALFSDRVIRFIAAYNKDEGGAKEVKELLEQYKGEEDDCMAYLAITYGDEPPAPSDDSDFPGPRSGASLLDHHTSRLSAFYKYYAPEKLASVGKMVETYQEDFPKMWRTLEARFGPELDVRLALGGLGLAGSGGSSSAEAQRKISDLEAKVVVLEAQLREKGGGNSGPESSSNTQSSGSDSSIGVPFITGLTPFSSLDTAVNMFYYLSGNQAADFMVSGFAANHQDAGLPKIFKYLWSIRQNKPEPFIQRKTASIGVSGVYPTVEEFKGSIYFVSGSVPPHSATAVTNHHFTVDGATGLVYESGKSSAIRGINFGLRAVPLKISATAEGSDPNAVKAAFEEHVRSLDAGLAGWEVKLLLEANKPKK